MGVHCNQVTSPRSHSRSRSPCTSPRVTCPRSYLRSGRCPLESQAAQLLQQTAHPALVNLPHSAFEIVCNSEGGEKLCWDSSTIHEWKATLVGHKGQAAPMALLHCLVSNLAETYRLQVSRAQANGKPPCLTVPSASLAPQRVIADIVLASFSAVLHSQQELQLTRIVFSVEDASMQRALAKAWERLRVDFCGGETTWKCICNRCGGVHETLACPNFVQSAGCDPDAQLRAEAMCRNSTPNATLFTSRDDRERVYEQPSTTSPKKVPSRKPPPNLASGYQELPHGDSGSGLLSPTDCHLSPIKAKSQNISENIGYNAEIHEPMKVSEPSSKSYDWKPLKPDSGNSSNQNGCRPKPLIASATYVQLLQLQPGFSELDLRTAYKKAVLQWHPDRPVWQGSTEKELQEAADMFRRVKEAYDVLSNKTSKCKV